MTSYVKFELEDGTIVYVESTDQPKGSSGLLPGKAAEAAGQAAVSFEKTVAGVRKMAAALLNNLRQDLPAEPEEVQINFGLKASNEVGGLVVARGGVEANYNVMLRWRSDKKEDDSEAEKPPKK